MDEWFVTAVEQHGPDIHAYLSRRSQVADDLLGEVWVTAYAARSTYDSTVGPPRAWLFGIARNVLHTYYRKHRLATTVVRLFGIDRPADETAAVDARLDAAALAPALRAAIADLPPPERELLLLIAWENLTPTEAAQVLNIPPGTARSRLHRAGQRLTLREEADR
ncbi:RNA polymerase sigma factor [Kribbella sp. NPDC026611]|uniref:RNA polymerase sigma factor n=1 Tax=Kribbella sp. NPDC026611 TaxID=3154911 RepID=UPI0033F4A584